MHREAVALAEKACFTSASSVAKRRALEKVSGRKTPDRDGRRPPIKCTFSSGRPLLAGVPSALPLLCSLECSTAVAV